MFISMNLYCLIITLFCMDCTIAQSKHYGTDHIIYEIGDSCKIESTGELGICRLANECAMLIKSLIDKKERPTVCGYDGFIEVVCCPTNTNIPNSLIGLYARGPDIPLNEICETDTISGIYGVNKYLADCFMLKSQLTDENRSEVICCPDDSIKEEVCDDYSDNKFEYTNISGGKCTMRNSGKSGHCTSVKQCNTRLPSINSSDYTICGYDCCNELICCPDPDPGFNMKSGQYCIDSSKLIYNSTKKISSLFSTKPVNSKCSKPQQSVKISTKKLDFPHMAALGYKGFDNETKWNCGGSLISDQYVLTAAHCIYFENLGYVKYVQLGEFNVGGNTPKIFNISKTIEHPDYKTSSHYNDIALVKLERKIIFNEFIRPACLPNRKETLYTKFTSSGWHSIEFLGTKSKSFSITSLEYFNHTICNENYKQEDSKLENGISDEIQICAGSWVGSQDSCFGETGGPLQLEHDEFYKMSYVIGVASFGRNCEFKGTPGVYTRVYPYISWIESIVWKN